MQRKKCQELIDFFRSLGIDVKVDSKNSVYDCRTGKQIGTKTVDIYSLDIVFIIDENDEVCSYLLNGFRRDISELGQLSLSEKEA